MREVLEGEKEDMNKKEKKRLVNTLSREVVKIIDKVIEQQFQEQDEKERKIRKEKMKVKIHCEDDVKEAFGISQARGKELLGKMDECYAELPQSFVPSDFLEKVYDKIEFTNEQEIAFVSFYAGVIVSEIARM